MINNCTVVGRITNNLELRRTGSNKAFIRVTLAVERNYTNKTTNKRDVDFISVIVWGQTAENMYKYLTKGSLIGIEGNIQTGRYEKNGVTIYSTDIIASKVQFMESKEVSERRKGVTSASENSFGNPFEDFGSPLDISDDDLPF